MMIFDLGLMATEQKNNYYKMADMFSAQQLMKSLFVTSLMDLLHLIWNTVKALSYPFSYLDFISQNLYYGGHLLYLIHILTYEK